MPTWLLKVWDEIWSGPITWAQGSHRGSAHFVLSKPPTQGRAGVFKRKYFVGKITSRMPPDFFQSQRDSQCVLSWSIFFPISFSSSPKRKASSLHKPRYPHTTLVSKMERGILLGRFPAQEWSIDLIWGITCLQNNTQVSWHELQNPTSSWRQLMHRGKSCMWTVCTNLLSARLVLLRLSQNWLNGKVTLLSFLVFEKSLNPYPKLDTAP